MSSTTSCTFSRKSAFAISTVSPKLPKQWSFILRLEWKDSNLSDPFSIIAIILMALRMFLYWIIGVIKVISSQDTNPDLLLIYSVY